MTEWSPHRETLKATVVLTALSVSYQRRSFLTNART
jgi:hypothetical protein